MQLSDLIAFIKKEDVRLRKCFGDYADEEKYVLARTVKLTEELGELCDEVLSCHSMQRRDKLEKRNADSLSDEFADVVIAGCLLAEASGIDIEQALERKMKKIDERYQAE